MFQILLPPKMGKKKIWGPNPFYFKYSEERNSFCFLVGDGKKKWEN